MNLRARRVEKCNSLFGAITAPTVAVLQTEPFACTQYNAVNGNSGKFAPNPRPVQSLHIYLSIYLYMSESSVLYKFRDLESICSYH